MDGWEETQRRERREHRGHVGAIFLEGVCGVCRHLAILAKETLGSNWFFPLRALSTGRSVSLGSVETELHLRVTIVQELSFANRSWKMDSPAHRSYFLMLPQSFETHLFQEAFLTTPPQQVTPSPGYCGEFTDWLLSLTHLVYFCKNVNFPGDKHVFAC